MNGQNLATMLYSFHLLDTTTARGVRLLAARGKANRVPGLHHAEPMTLMELGAPMLSPRRVQFRQMAWFAAWESEEHLEAHLADDAHGRWWSEGWHVRLEFLRRWGKVTAFDGLPVSGAAHAATEPVVAVTLARLKVPQVPRFIRWGRPVEVQIRDDPGQTLALAAAAPPRTISTFTVWKSAQAMTDMVMGKSGSPDAARHAAAMRERERKDFHIEFTTMRFRCLSEHGAWRGRTGIVPAQGPGRT
ncbi:MAG: hypothetical protein ACI867_000264 [Glaciecola sp.]|jgi:hypothetical protein